MVTNPFVYTDKLIIISYKDNLINYSAGPVDFYLNVDRKVISISCTSNYENMWKFCFITISEAWEFDTNELIQISEFSYELPYSLKILENYLETRIYFGDELG